jgi:hypothetical protein
VFLEVSECYHLPHCAVTPQYYKKPFILILQQGIVERELEETLNIQKNMQLNSTDRKQTVEIKRSYYFENIFIKTGQCRSIIIIM